MRMRFPWLRIAILASFALARTEERAAAQTPETYPYKSCRKGPVIKRNHKMPKAPQSIRNGEVLFATVDSIADYGAFMHLGAGQDGDVYALLHVSDLGWDRRQVDEVLNVGDVLRVKMLKANPKSQRHMVGLRQLIDDPWNLASGCYKVGERLKATVSRTEMNGDVLIRLGYGIEAVVPKARRPKKRLRYGQKVNVKIEHMNTKQGYIEISLPGMKLANPPTPREIRWAAVERLMDVVPNFKAELTIYQPMLESGTVLHEVEDMVRELARVTETNARATKEKDLAAWSGQIRKRLETPTPASVGTCLQLLDQMRDALSRQKF